MEKATILEVKDYFGYDSTQKFMADWKELSKEDQEWFKEEVKNQLP